MRLLKFILSVGLLSSLQASSLLKVICDVDNENIYLDGKFKTECDNGELVKLLLNAGSHKLKAIKYNKDGSYYKFDKTFKIGDGVEKSIEIDSKKIIPPKTVFFKKSDLNVKKIKFISLNSFVAEQSFLYGDKLYLLKDNIVKVVNLNNSNIETKKFDKKNHFNLLKKTKNSIYLAGYENYYRGGLANAIILKTSNNLNLEWQKSFGTNDDNDEQITNIVINKDIEGSGFGWMFAFTFKLTKNGKTIFYNDYSVDKEKGNFSSLVKINNAIYGILKTSDLSYIVKLDNNMKVISKKQIVFDDADESKLKAYKDKLYLINKSNLVVFNKNLDIVNKLKFKGNIKDITVYKNNIFVIISKNDGYYLNVIKDGLLDNTIFITQKSQDIKLFMQNNKLVFVFYTKDNTNIALINVNNI